MLWVTRCSSSVLDALALDVVRRSARSRASRVGGDEFAILLPQASVDDGLVIARRTLACSVPVAASPVSR